MRCAASPASAAWLGRKEDDPMSYTSELEMSRRGFVASGAATAAVIATPAIAALQTAPEATATPITPMRFKVNGEQQNLALDTRTTLLDALREHLHRTGTKKG